MQQRFLCLIIWIWVLFTSFLNPANATEKISTAPRTQAWYREQVHELAAKHKIPLIQIAYKTPDCYIQFESTQFDFVSATKDCSTIYLSCSISKVVFSYIILRLYDLGIIDLDKPLWEYSGSVEERFRNAYNDSERSEQNVRWAKMITARMILTHTTGLPRWASNWGEKSPSETAKLRFAWTPDTGFRYSNEAMWYLQRVVEKITGLSLEQLARKYVLDPLGMADTSFEWREAYRQTAASSYNANLECLGQSAQIASCSAYSMRTNVKDFGRFIEALMEGKLLKPETHRMMISPCRHTGRACQYYGLGIQVMPNIGLDCGPVWVHSGSARGFRCRFWVLPKQKTWFIYFTNSANGRKIHPELVRLFLPEYSGTEF